MKYGIYITKKVFNIYEDGSEKQIDEREGWLSSNGYDMKSHREDIKEKAVGFDLSP